jgi:hypothetical protein
MSSIVEQIKALHLSGREVRDIIENLFARERKRARDDAPMFASLLVSTMRVGKFDESLVADAEKLHAKITEATK